MQGNSAECATELGESARLRMHVVKNSHRERREGRKRDVFHSLCVQASTIFGLLLTFGRHTFCLEYPYGTVPVLIIEERVRLRTE